MKKDPAPEWERELFEKMGNALGRRKDVVLGYSPGRLYNEVFSVGWYIDENHHIYKSKWYSLVCTQEEYEADPDGIAQEAMESILQDCGLLIRGSR